MLLPESSKAIGLVIGGASTASAATVRSSKSRFAIYIIYKREV